MKALIVATLLLIASGSASAGYYGGHGYYGGGRGYYSHGFYGGHGYYGPRAYGPGFRYGAAGLIVGGVVGAAYLAQPNVIYAPPPQQPVYQQVSQFDANCGCYVTVMRQVGWQ